jgi:hypothetical protein
MLLKRQPLATKPIAESVGVRGISEAKGHEELPFIVPPAPAPGLDAALAVEGQHVFARRSETARR